jgi:hypothetical protein
VGLAGGHALSPVPFWSSGPPLAGGDGVVLLAVGTVLAIGILMSFRWFPLWFLVLLGALALVISTTNLVAGLLLHRTIEVT